MVNAELIRLFKAVEIVSKRKKQQDKKSLLRTVRKGFIFSPEVVYNYKGQEDELVKFIEKEVGLTPEQLNSSFHKSWNKVKTASMEQLFMEQIVHYITTYGFERLGIYSESSVYIPNEELDIPDIEDVVLVTIKGYTKDKIKEKISDLLKAGIAFKEDTLKDIIEVAKYVNFTEIDSVKNKEAKIALCDYLGIFPKNPTEFLRYTIYKALDKTLLIKDPATIELLKAGGTTNEIRDLFIKYNKTYGYKYLAEIFYRFKPIFLAFRSNKDMRPIVNKIRKLAYKYHKPMKEDLLNNITGKLKRKEKISKQQLEESLKDANTFRKIRLAYALKYRTGDIESILYKVRNGKGWACGYEFDNKTGAKTVLNTVTKSIADDIRKNVEDKRIFIPNYINYTLPATEKQFTGNFPSGTCVEIDKDMIFGVYWENVNRQRIDLDLSLIHLGGKLGWDAAYRSGDRKVLFSGDMTDASGGATELFYIQKQVKQAFLVNLNYFNYYVSLPVPFDIIIAKEQVSNLKKNYMVNPNNVVSTVKSKIDVKQKILGLVVVTTKGSKFYFSETGLGDSITSRNNEFTEHSRKYLIDYHRNMINLKNVLELAGAKIVTKEDEFDIDLSPESLEKDTIINLLK